MCQTEKPGTWIPGSISNPAPAPQRETGTTAYSAARTNAGHLLIDIPPLSTHRETNVPDMGISCKARIQH
ncbi:hypothetical protein ABIB35_003754 [Arthrobacter sp. UYP6]